jgi:hypothetical protein
MTTADPVTGVELEFEFEFNAIVKPPVLVGNGPHGTRMFFETIDGTLTGERVSGRVMSGGGDWFLLGTDGWGTLDTRAEFEASDGAVIYASYSA